MHSICLWVFPVVLAIFVSMDDPAAYGEYVMLFCYK